MKKFIIHFHHKVFLFKAKVLFTREHGKMHISTTLINDELSFLLEGGNLMFIERSNGFDLLLFKQDRSFEILNWEIRSEYLDKSQIIDSNVFSLS